MCATAGPIAVRVNATVPSGLPRHLPTVVPLPAPGAANRGPTGNPRAHPVDAEAAPFGPIDVPRHPYQRRPYDTKQCGLGAADGLAAVVPRGSRTAAAGGSRRAVTASASPPDRRRPPCSGEAAAEQYADAPREHADVWTARPPTAW